MFCVSPSYNRQICFAAMILFVFMFVLMSCGRTDKPATRQFNTDEVYFNYSISAEEGDDNLTVLIRFLMGENDEAIPVPEGASVMLDDEILKPDSSKKAGTFYEVHKPITSFTGKHSITYTDASGKQYKHEFNFQPLVLSTYVPDTVQRQDLQLELLGLEEEDYVRILATDTAFYSEGINRLDTVKNGQLSISVDDLGKLVNGPIQLELNREYEIPVENGMGTGGKMAITYRLRREFILKD